MSFLADSRQFEGFRSPFATGFPGFWAAFGDGVLLRYYPLAENRLKPHPCCKNTTLKKDLTWVAVFGIL